MDFSPKSPRKGEVQTVPMLRGRIISINGVPAAEIKAKESGRWVLRGDRGLTYSATKPAQCQHFQKANGGKKTMTGANLVSFTAEEADEVGVEVGGQNHRQCFRAQYYRRRCQFTGGGMANPWLSILSWCSHPTPSPAAPHAHMATLRVGQKRHANR